LKKIVLTFFVESWDPSYVIYVAVLN